MGDDYDDQRGRRHFGNASDTFSIQSTAGAIPVRNKKGEISMQKVKVKRYISGKKPEYARGQVSDSEDEASEDEHFSFASHRPHRHHGDERDEDEAEFVPTNVDAATFAADTNDPRLLRLQAAKKKLAEETEHNGGQAEHRHRRIHDPEVLSDASSGNDDEDADKHSNRNRRRLASIEVESEDESSSGDDDNDDLDDEGIKRRRELMRQRAEARAQIGIGQEEIMDKEEEKSGSEEDDGDEDDEDMTEEDTSDSEKEEGARLKPVFVRKKDRLTVQEREREEARQRQAEREALALAEERRRLSVKLVEESVRKETLERKANENDPSGLNEVVTDDENEELEYESWKVRELKRLKRDRDDREQFEREAAEVERLRSMTEEERRLEAKVNPRVITNKASKGKYKFLQKYYHRGAYFLDREENVFSRDFSAPTLEDKFDKTVLPKVMQVKNFGRSGRTKYTHLVDQDTTQFDSAWSQETAQNLKFQTNHAAGSKAALFDRPSFKKKK